MSVLALTGGACCRNGRWFYIGQRVRLSNTASAQLPVGMAARTGVIVNIGQDVRGLLGHSDYGRGYAMVRVELGWEERYHGREYCFWLEHLEPIDE